MRSKRSRQWRQRERVAFIKLKLLGFTVEGGRWFSGIPFGSGGVLIGGSMKQWFENCRAALDHFERRT